MTATAPELPSPVKRDEARANNMASDSTPTLNRMFEYDIKAYTAQPEHNGDHAMSDSPFDAPTAKGEAVATNRDQENVSPSKSRHSRVLSGNELSPLKILGSRDADSRATESASPTKSPRKWATEKRFPVKVHNGGSPEKLVVTKQDVTIENAVKENKDLAKAIQIFEDEDTTLGVGESAGDISRMTVDMAQDRGDEEEEGCGADDTMLSTFSTFSAVPNLTMFAKIGHTPTKFARPDPEPSIVRKQKSPAQRSLSPHKTPRPSTIHEENNNTTSLLDFAEQPQGFSSRYAQQQIASSRGLSPGKRYHNTVSATPKKRHSHLLDLDIDLPTLPTPRSLPSITPRELESLRSSFLSEVSNLKASLMGKEAEVMSLKSAVGDAEKRVGESQEEVRELQAQNQTLQDDKCEWEQRGRDMERVLRDNKEEIVTYRGQNDNLNAKLEESEKRREAAEIMAQEAESKLAAMKNSRAAEASSASGDKSAEEAKAMGSREVEIAVEKVAKELHAMYKGKHELKVVALKKSYENRWLKKISEMEKKNEELKEENDKLRDGHNATMIKSEANHALVDEERKEQAVKHSAKIKELEAEIQKLGAVIISVKTDNHDLRELLQKERVEKGELVLLAEEMMAIQNPAKYDPDVPYPYPPAAPHVEGRATTPTYATAPSSPAKTASPIKSASPLKSASPVKGHKKAQSIANTADAFRASTSRPTGLRPPVSAIKKAKTTDTRTAGSSSSGSSSSAYSSAGLSERRPAGLPRPGSGMAGRSGGIMSSIEKMGNYRGGHKQ
ncbi:hypothetical protein F5Y18DRAFT_397088 [Xylariaceae sp. FL1019]|nr:hypothetical protein F5Y18DRAFT_397088 [Xylariaceae sp. FL1019]